MILDCPSCHARYLVPAAHFASGPRLVRCAKCSFSWSADLPQDPAASFAQKMADFAPVEEKPISPGSNLPALREQKSLMRRMALLLIVAVAAALFSGWFLLDRKEIAHRHPSLEKLYDRIGFHIYHAGEGLSLDQVRSEEQFDSGIMELMVTGQIRNDTAKTQVIPNLLATAVGADGKPMQRWQIDAPAAKVEPGASVSFASTIRAPQGTVVEVRLTFIEPEHEP